MTNWQDTVGSISAGIAAVAALASIWFVWKAIRSSNDAQKVATLIAKTVPSEEIIGDRPRKVAVVVVENLGPAVARDVVVRVRNPSKGWKAHPHTNEEGDRDAFTTSIKTLAPGASLRRMTSATIVQNPSSRIWVNVEWSDASSTDRRSDEFEVEGF